MIDPTQLDLQRAREITLLYGGNGLSTLQSERLVAEKLAEWRRAISVPDAEAALLAAGHPICVRVESHDVDIAAPRWVIGYPSVR